MAKYIRYIFMALMVSGLLAISYAGCGGGTDETSGGGTTTPTPAPTGTPTAPPTNPPGACEGDALRVPPRHPHKVLRAV